MKAKFFYTGIRVKDLEASVKFYTTVLGMKVRGRNTVEAAKGTVVELICEEGGNTLELNYYEEGSPFDTKYEVGEGLDHLAFVVNDLDTALAEAKTAGHPMVQEMREPGSRYAYVKDPDGILDKEFGRPEVTYWIGREDWGKGLATTALAKFLREVRVRLIYGRAAKDNLGSLRVLEKCGFKVVGYDRGFASARGKEIDEVILELR